MMSEYMKKNKTFLRDLAKEWLCMAMLLDFEMASATVSIGGTV